MVSVHAGWRSPKVLLIALAAMGLVASVAGLERPAPRPDRGNAPGASAVSFRTTDGVTLNARFWARDPQRIVIYLHEYRGNQTAWWPMAEEGGVTAPSALTIDFRGHGTSEGSADDVAGMPEDAKAALAFAHERGFQRIVLVGAGMGAAAGIIAAADDPNAGVLGLSAPSEFASIQTTQAISSVERRVALLASDGDLSAGYSVQEFRRHASIPSSRIVMLKGLDHGEAMLTGDRRLEAGAAFRRLLADLWRS